MEHAEKLESKMTLATKQIEWSVNTIIAIVFTIALIVAAFVVYGWYNSAKVNEATVVEQAVTADATSDISTEVSNALDGKGKDETAVNNSRRSYEAKSRAVISSDKDSAAWSNTDVDVKLRAIARESREARDRLAIVEVGSEDAD